MSYEAGCDASGGYYNPPSSPAVCSSSGGYFNPSSETSVWTTSSSRNYHSGYTGTTLSYYDDDCNCGNRQCEIVKRIFITIVTIIAFIILIYALIWYNTT